MNPQIQQDFSFNGKFAKYLQSLIEAEVGADPAAVQHYVAVHTQDLLHVRYWIRYGAPTWRQYRTLGDVIREANAWHVTFAEANQSSGHPSFYELGPGTNYIGEEVIVGGKKMWVVPITFNDAENEGNLMGHCIGKYDQPEDIADMAMFAFSLRDVNNQPHVTWGYTNKKARDYDILEWEQEAVWTPLFNELAESYPDEVAALEAAEGWWSGREGGLQIKNEEIPEPGDDSWPIWVRRVVRELSKVHPEVAARQDVVLAEGRLEIFKDLAYNGRLQFDQLQGKEDNAPVAKYRPFLRAFFEKHPEIAPIQGTMWEMRTLDDEGVLIRLMDGDVDMDDVLDAFDTDQLGKLYTMARDGVAENPRPVRENAPVFFSDMVFFAMDKAGEGWSDERSFSLSEGSGWEGFLNNVLWNIDGRENTKVILENSYEALSTKRHGVTSSIFRLPGGRRYLLDKLKHEDSPSVLFLVADHLAMDMQDNKTLMGDVEMRNALNAARVRLDEMLEFEEGSYGLRSKDPVITEDTSAIPFFETQLRMGGSDQDLAAALTTLSRSLAGAAMPDERFRHGIMDLYRRDPDRFERVLQRLDPEVIRNLGLDRDLINDYKTQLRLEDPPGQPKLESEYFWDRSENTSPSQKVRAVELSRRDLNERRRRSVQIPEPPEDQRQLTMDLAARVGRVITALDDIGEWSLADSLFMISPIR